MALVDFQLALPSEVVEFLAELAFLFLVVVHARFLRDTFELFLHFFYFGGDFVLRLAELRFEGGELLRMLLMQGFSLG